MNLFMLKMCRFTFIVVSGAKCFLGTLSSGCLACEEVRNAHGTEGRDRHTLSPAASDTAG